MVTFIRNRPKYSVTGEDWWRLRRLKLTQAHAALQGEVHVQAALTPPELLSFWRMVHQRYVEAGLVDQGVGLWTTPYHFLPETRFFGTFLGKEGPLCVAAIVFDSVAGLPVDMLYRAELDRLRAKGARLAEIFSLASKRDMVSRNTLFHLFRVLYRYALFCGVTDLVIAIHPKHADFYERLLLFELVGERRLHVSFGVSFVLEHLDLQEAPRRYREAYRHFPKEYNLYYFFSQRDLPEEKLFWKIKATEINFLDFSGKKRDKIAPESEALGA